MSGHFSSHIIYFMGQVFGVDGGGGGGGGLVSGEGRALPSESNDGLLMSGQITRCPDGRTLCPETFVGILRTFCRIIMDIFYKTHPPRFFFQLRACTYTYTHALTPMHACMR